MWQVVQHIRDEVKRLEHARSIMPTVRPLLTELHTTVGHTYSVPVSGDWNDDATTTDECARLTTKCEQGGWRQQTSP